MREPMEIFIDHVLPLSGSVESRAVQWSARKVLREHLAPLLAVPGTTTYDDLLATVASALANTETTLAALQVRLAFAPHRRPNQAVAWAAINVRAASLPGACCGPVHRTVGA